MPSYLSTEQRSMFIHPPPFFFFFNSHRLEHKSHRKKKNFSRVQYMSRHLLGFSSVSIFWVQLTDSTCSCHIRCGGVCYLSGKTSCRSLLLAGRVLEHHLRTSSCLQCLRCRTGRGQHCRVSWLAIRVCSDNRWWWKLFGDRKDVAVISSVGTTIRLDDV